MEQVLLEQLALRVEKLLAAYQGVKAENRRLQDRVQQLTEQQQAVRGRVDVLLAKLEEIDTL
jgi:FtsZ-binding cell division protein ZapB